jgi:hypothetical protein
MGSVVIKSLIEAADHCEEKAMNCKRSGVDGLFEE